MSQSRAVLGIFLRDWPLRVGSLGVPIIGAAGVTFILVSVLSIANGISEAMDLAGGDDVAIVLSRDAPVETSSRLSDEEAAAIVTALSGSSSQDAPRERVISPELLQTVDTISRGGEAGAQVLARGISASGLKLRTKFRIVEGRLFTPGRLEVIVGRGLARDFAGLTPGTTLTGSTHEWSIVGIFEDGGGTGESEVWMDLDSARTESGSRAPISSLRVQPLAGAYLNAFREAARRNPQLQIRVEPEREHQLRQFSQAIGRVRLFALVLALLLGIGAVVASVNSMYAAIAIRQRAVATLWALGFAPSAMATAVFAEATLLGLLGGAAGAGAAILVADGYGLSLLNGATRTPFALSARVTSASVVQGLSFAAILTALAAIAPCVSIAWRWPCPIPRPTPP